MARLGVKEYFSSVPDKSAKLDELIASTGLDPARSAYMGDDLPDLRVMQRMALPCCPADAAEEIKAVSKFISAKPGGYGCVRDLLEQAMKVQGKWLTNGAHLW
jgi:3-deoxy-D-manno-octulosonate 8-phosphate phosphatase (KDO 8-P phosphatase)